MGQSGAPLHTNQSKYFDLLARYYVLKRQHMLAAHVLLRLAERRSTDAGDVPTLEKRLAVSLHYSFYYRVLIYGRMVHRLILQLALV